MYVCFRLVFYACGCWKWILKRVAFFVKSCFCLGFELQKWTIRYSQFPRFYTCFSNTSSSPPTPPPHPQSKTINKTSSGLTNIIFRGNQQRISSSPPPHPPFQDNQQNITRSYNIKKVWIARDGKSSDSIYMYICCRTAETPSPPQWSWSPLPRVVWWYGGCQSLMLYKGCMNKYKAYLSVCRSKKGSMKRSEAEAYLIAMVLQSISSPLWWWCAADIASKDGGDEEGRKGSLLP